MSQKRLARQLRQRHTEADDEPNERIASCHLFDQIDLILRDPWPTKRRPAFPFPIQSESFIVPSDDSFRLDDQ
jgi:hypothetical protein